MSKYAINPNALPDEKAEERAALDRETAHLHHFDTDGLGEGAVSDASPLPPLMSPLPDPRYPHGDVDAIEQRLAEIRAARESDAKQAPPPEAVVAFTAQLAAEIAAEAAAEAPAPAQVGPAVGEAAKHPLIVSLVSTLPAPGTAWPEQARIDWLHAAASIFRLVYASGAKGEKAA